jgi:outer membrane protein TolC
MSGPMIMRAVVSARSMCRLAVIVAATCMFAVAAHAFSNEAVADAQALLKTMQQRVQTGSATPAEIAQVERYLLDMKYKAGQIRLAEYCRKARPSIEAVFDGADKEFRTGRGTTRELIDARRDWFQFKAMCGLR